MTLEPFRIFFTFALVFLVAPIWVKHPFMEYGFFFMALTGWLWNTIPVWFDRPLPQLRELLPIILLSIFMMVLVGAPQRSTSEALLATAGGLLLFRGLIYLLLRIRFSKNPIPLVAKAVIIGFLIEMLFSIIHVYSTFRFVSPTVLQITHLLSVRLLMAILAWAWYREPMFTESERKGAALLLIGIFDPYFAGIGLMLVTITFLKLRGFRYQHEVE